MKPPVFLVALAVLSGVCVHGGQVKSRLHHEEGHKVSPEDTDRVVYEEAHNGDKHKQVKDQVFDNVKVLDNDNEKVGQDNKDKVVVDGTLKMGHASSDKVVENIHKVGNRNTDKIVHDSTDKIVRDNTDKIVHDQTDKIVRDNTDKIVHDSTDKIVRDNTDKIVHDSTDKIVPDKTDKIVPDKSDKVVQGDSDKMAADVTQRLGHDTSHKPTDKEVNKEDILPRHEVGARARHMKVVYGWSEIDYVFPDEKTRDNAIVEETFIPGNSVPIGVDVDPVTGKVFISMPRFKPGNAATLATVSKKKGFGEEHMLSPYPSWAWHKQGDCEAITSVFRVFVDDCRRLWVLDSGTVGGAVDVAVGVNRICPAQILIFDLDNDQIIKKYEFPEAVIKPESVLTTIVVDVRDTSRKCKDSYAYVADVSGFGLLVYNYAKDESWRVTSNEMYPYPPFGLFNIHGSQFDLMDGILGLALTPKKSNVDRVLYFHSLASNVESWVSTSLLRNKSNFANGENKVQRQFYTSPGKRSGQAASEAFDENGVLFFSVLPDMSINCWNSKKDYIANNLVEVDRDEEAFQFIAGMKVVKNQQGVSELWAVSSRFQRHMVGTVDSNDINYRVMKAPLDKLVYGTSCEVPKKPQQIPAGVRPGARPPTGGNRPTVRPGGSYNG